MKINTFIFLTGFVLFTCACSEQDPFVQEDTNLPVVLSAYVNNSIQASSRKMEKGTISDGRYYLTFTNKEKQQQTATTLFADGTGYPYIYQGNETTGTILNWNYVNNEGESCKLTLDNVPYNESETAETSVSLDKETYKASVYTAECTNDIVWGQINDAKWNSPEPLKFELKHQMASFVVNIQVDKNNSRYDDLTSFIEKNGVKVTLSNVITESLSFNRTNGIVTPAKDKTSTLIHNQTLDDNGNTDIWLFPPQKFGENDRPELEITLTDNDNQTITYKGILNESMFEGTENNPTTKDLEFKKGQLLKIRVSLVENIQEQEIRFLPAVVEDWVSIGSVGIISRQIGIYDVTDYNIVVKAYNETPKNEEILKLYGTKGENEIWTIHIFKNIGTENEKFIPFCNDKKISLILNGYTVFGKENAEDLIAQEPVEDNTEDNLTNEEEAQL